MERLSDKVIKQVDNFVQMSSDAQSGECNPNKLTYLPRFMCFASLPHSSIDSNTYTRIIFFGTIKLILKITSPYGIPYGVWARRLLAFLCQEALRTKSKTIFLGKNLSSFLKRVGAKSILATGGKRGTLTILQEQAKRLFSSSIHISCAENQSWEFENTVFASKGLLFWDTNEKQDWAGHITLSDVLYEDIIKNAVPVENGILSNMQSSLAFDLYLWIRWKSFQLKNPVHISWKSLFLQFGFSYSQNSRGLFNFKKEFHKHIERNKNALNSKSVVILDKKNGLSLFPKKVLCKK